MGSGEPPAGVVFDLGNVLINWDPYPAIAAGVGPEEAKRFLEAEDFDFWAWNLGPDSGDTWEVAEDAVRRSHPHWAEHALAYRAHFLKSLVGEVAGTGDVVRELHAAGVRLFALTNWSHELYPHAPENFEVMALFDDVVVSGTEKVAKPDPRVFQILAERSGLPLDQLVFVDDKQANVDAAAALGMQAILFTDAAALRTELRSRGLPV